MNRANPSARGPTIQAARPEKRRRALIAGPLSLAMPGLGQLYNGSWRRAAVFIGIATALEIAGAAILAVPPRSALLPVIAFTIVASTIVFRFVAMVDAVRTARRLVKIVLMPWNRLLVYLAVFAAGILFGIALDALLGGHRFYRSYSFPSGSMSPTVLVGERFMTWQGYYAGHLPERGDLAIFKLPRDQTTDYLKRVVGLPGDRIQMIGGVLHINGEAVRRERLGDWMPSAGGRGVPQFAEMLPGGRSYRTIEHSDRGELDDTAVYVVPPDHYFVLGDNRDNSLDSRIGTERNGVGFVPRRNLRDRPILVFWSTEWRRLGAALN